MNHSITRGRSLGILLTAIASMIAGATQPIGAAEKKAKQEYYELRIYQAEDAERQAVVKDYLKNALMPALGRMGIDRVGVFTVMNNKSDFSVFALIPYPTLDAFSQLNPKLAADRDYQRAATKYFALPMKKPAYRRVDSRLMKAFAGMPVIEMPAETKANKPRMFELRIYESHNEDAARRKVDMFNSGEIQIMRDVKMAPVFYGETLIGRDVPNLIYMLSASDLAAHQAHWKAFSAHPEWTRMKRIPKYKGTVSKITNWMLAPTEFSQM